MCRIRVKYFPPRKFLAGSTFGLVKAAGCPHFREWVRTVLLPKLSESEKEHFWSVATMADFRLAKLRSEEEILHVLSTDDSLEIALRELAAKVYELRHGDREGAKYLLAVSPPGTAVDIAPLSEKTRMAGRKTGRSVVFIFVTYFLHVFYIFPRSEER